MELVIGKKCTWVIAYINRDFIYRVENDIKKFCKIMGPKIQKPHLLQAYIPTVRILKKQFKGREIFEEVPFLFNYGFFQIPNSNLDVDFLLKMKEHILCIHQWVKDSRAVTSTKPTLITGKETEKRHDIIQYAIAKPEELFNIVYSHKINSVYDKYDIDNLKPEMVVKLKGYPFDEMDARIIKVDKDKEIVKIELLMDGLIKKTSVSFSNILYTIYHGTFDENDFKEKSLEEMGLKGRNYMNKIMKDNES